jgi:hypothetical protein
MTRIFQRFDSAQLFDSNVITLVQNAAPTTGIERLPTAVGPAACAQPRMSALIDATVAHP